MIYVLLIRESDKRLQRAQIHLVYFKRSGTTEWQLPRSPSPKRRSQPVCYVQTLPPSTPPTYPSSMRSWKRPWQNAQLPMSRFEFQWYYMSEEVTKAEV